MSIPRRKTRVIRIGKVYIGGNYPVAIQSMVKCKTSDTRAAIHQINKLEKCGCEIIRLAVKDREDAGALRQIKRQVNLPVVADIHFDWNLAMEAIESGVDKIRLNPGNIYKKSQIREIVNALKIARIPLRIGLNSGSVKGRYTESVAPISPLKLGAYPERVAPISPLRLGAYPAGLSMADKLVKSALDYIRAVENFKFNDIVVSLKASTVTDTIQAYRKLAKVCDYPLHLGVTATGLPAEGAIKSAIAIGSLLQEGIGDTIRVSLTAQPEEEIRAAKSILEAVGARNFKPGIISCPTCGRCEVDLIKIVKDLERKLSTVSCKLYTRQPKVAVMGCIVNGPGEAKEADIGIAFGKREGLLFKKGKAIKKVNFSNCVDTLLKEMKNIHGG